MNAVYGVSRVVAYIKRVISENKQLAAIDVSGEVSERSERNGRIYFNLKEGADLLRCVVWSDVAPKLPPFANGDAVVVSGNFTTYAAQSVYQIDVKALEPTGIGKLYARFQTLRRKLEAEGLFEAARKRPMPAFPQRIVLVSAPGKGAEDFLSTMARRAPHIAIRFLDTLVQGIDAPVKIAEALDAASAMDVDVIVLARGGGSYEDLFAFNEEPVVRAIVRAKRPVLTAIAHTADLHLADAVADMVCATPSNGAQYFGEIRDRYVQRLRGLVDRLDRSLVEKQRSRAQRYDFASAALVRLSRGFVNTRRQRLLSLENRLTSQTPVARLGMRQRRLGEAAGRLRAIARGFTNPRRNHVERLNLRLDALDPQAPLQRGYAMIFNDGALVRDANAVPLGARIQARVQHGTLTGRVEERTDE
jgi:exodeoxyribonuclease VII large subunit